jgi:hypothetical protein
MAGMMLVAVGFVLVAVVMRLIDHVQLHRARSVVLLQHPLHRD